MGWFDRGPRWPTGFVASEFRGDDGLSPQEAVREIKRWFLVHPGWHEGMVVRRLNARIWDGVIGGRRIGYAMRVGFINGRYSKDYAAISDREFPVSNQARAENGRTHLGFFPTPETAIIAIWGAETSWQSEAAEAYGAFLDEQTPGSG